MEGELSAALVDRERREEILLRLKLSESEYQILLSALSERHDSPKSGGSFLFQFGLLTVSLAFVGISIFVISRGTHLSYCLISQHLRFYEPASSLREMMVYDIHITHTETTQDHYIDYDIAIHPPTSPPDDVVVGPDRILFHYQWLDVTSLSAEAFLTKVITKTVTTKHPGWVTQKRIGEKRRKVEVSIREINHLASTVGRAYMLDLARPATTEGEWWDMYQINIRTELPIEPRSLIGRLCKTRCNYSINLSAGAFDFLSEKTFDPDVEHWPYDGLKICDKRRIDAPLLKIDYTWEPAAKGQFIGSSDLLAAKCFYESGEDHIESEFTYESSGNRWIPYLTGVFGCFGVVTPITNFLRKRSQQIGRRARCRSGCWDRA